MIAFVRKLEKKGRANEGVAPDAPPVQRLRQHKPYRPAAARANATTPPHSRGPSRFQAMNTSASLPYVRASNRSVTWTLMAIIIVLLALLVLRAVRPASQSLRRPQSQGSSAPGLWPHRDDSTRRAIIA
jgi:hypothetical protein